MSRAGMRCDSEELAPGRARPAPSTGLSTTRGAAGRQRPASYSSADRAPQRPPRRNWWKAVATLTTSEASAQPTTTGRDPAAAAKRMNMLRMASTAKTTATTVTVVSVCDVATGASSSGLSEGTARRRAEDGWLVVASRATTDMVPCFLRRRRCGARPCPARLCVRPSSLGPAVNVQHLRALRYVVSITSARRRGGPTRAGRTRDSRARARRSRRRGRPRGPEPDTGRSRQEAGRTGHRVTWTGTSPPRR